MKLTQRQRRILAEIKASGEDVVIEDDWMIYLATSRTCPFGWRNKPGDIEAVRDRMTQLEWQDVGVYRIERENAEKRHAEKAIELIREGRYAEAQLWVKQADAETFTDVQKIEIYTFKSEEKNEDDDTRGHGAVEHPVN